MPKNDKSTATRAVEMAVQQASDCLGYLAKSEPIPFMKRKVSGSEIRRHVEPAMEGRDYVKMQEMIDKYGYENVNQTMGRIMKPKNGG